MIRVTAVFGVVEQITRRGILIPNRVCRWYCVLLVFGLMLILEGGSTFRFGICRLASFRIADVLVERFVAASRVSMAWRFG